MGSLLALRLQLIFLSARAIQRAGTGKRPGLHSGDFEAMLASWIILGLAAPAAAQVNRSSHFLSKQAVDVSSQGLRCGGLDLPENLGAITI